MHIVTAFHCYVNDDLNIARVLGCLLKCCMSAIPDNNVCLKIHNVT